MKIGVDAMLLGGNYSGVEVAIEGLCEGLCEVAEPGSVVIFGRQSLTGQVRDQPRLNLRTAPAWTASRPGRILWEHTFLPREAKRCGVDLLHAPGYVLPTGWHGPSVLTVYDMIALQYPQWCNRLNVWHYAIMLPRSIRQASRVIVPSHVVKHDILELVNISEEKIRVVEPGISAMMRPANDFDITRLRKANKLPERFILWVGNIEPKKNLGGMIKAFEIAARDIAQDFVIAGKPYIGAQEIFDLIEKSPARERIHYTGFIPVDLLPALYTTADLLVHWSYYEGAGLTPMEAMCCGTPAVISDGGALPEWAGQVAPVVPLGEPEELAEQIVLLLRDDVLCQKLRTHGQNWAQQYTWARHARKLLGIYREVI